MSTLNERARLLASVAACALVAAAPQAWAQNDVAAVEEIVVTATRTEQALSKVPVSVAAYTQETMDAQGVKAVDDIARITPGISFRRGGLASGGSNVSIRGISSGAGAATTGIYIDDTPIQVRTIGFSAANAYPAIFDLERVEVLRGPQGTLFGAGSQGGAIRFITPQPRLSGGYNGYFRGEAAATQGGDPSGELGLAIGAPLVEDRLAFRASAWARRDGGYVDRVDRNTGAMQDQNSNWQDTQVLRFALSAAPTEGLVITPSILYQNTYLNSTNSYWPNLSDPGKQQYISANKVSSSDRTRFILPAIQAEWEAPFATFASNTSYYFRNTEAVTDYSYYIPASIGIVVTPQRGVPGLPDYTNPTQFDNKQMVWTQEVRIQSNNPDARLRWIFGAFGSWAKQISLQRVPGPVHQWQGLLDTLPPASAASFRRFPLVGGNLAYFAQNVSHDQQVALFGEVNFRITDQLTVIGGLRYSKAKFDFLQDAQGPLNFGNSIGGGEQSESPLTPKVSVSYQADANNLFYATAAKGFRAGGANYPLTAVCQPFLAELNLGANPATYTSDSVWSYEIGSKNRLLDGRLVIDASIYTIDWSDIQQNIALRCGLGFTTNLGTATSKGFDFVGTFKPTAALTLTAAIGYNNSERTENVLGAPNAAGIRPVLGEKGESLGAPPWVVSLTAEYVLEVLGRDAFVRGDVQYTDKIGVTSTTNPRNASYDPLLIRLPATTVANLRAGVRFDGWEVTGFVSNMFNESAPLSHGHVGRLNEVFQDIGYRPRTVGTQISRRF